MSKFPSYANCRHGISNGMLGNLSTRIQIPGREQVISVAVVVIRSRYLKGKVQGRTRLESLDCAAQTGKLAQVWSCLHLHVSLQVSEPFDIMQVPAPVAAAVDPEWEAWRDQPQLKVP